MHQLLQRKAATTFHRTDFEAGTRRIQSRRDRGDCGFVVICGGSRKLAAMRLLLLPDQLVTARHCKLATNFSHNFANISTLSERVSTTFADKFLFICDVADQTVLVTSILNEHSVLHYHLRRIKVNPREI